MGFYEELMRRQVLGQDLFAYNPPLQQSHINQLGLLQPVCGGGGGGGGGVSSPVTAWDPTSKEDPRLINQHADKLLLLEEDNAIETL